MKCQIAVADIKKNVIAVQSVIMIVREDALYVDVPVSGIAADAINVAMNSNVSTNARNAIGDSR